MNKTIIDLGFLNITWYAFLIVLSFVLGAYIVLSNKRLQQTFKNKDVIYDYFFYLIIFSILGARIWYVVFSINMYISNPIEIFAIWHGGLAIHGGILAGLLYTIYFSKKNLISVSVLTDAIVPALLLGQAIGRWGNFINQEAHGPQTSFEFLKDTLHLPSFIINGMNIEGIYYQPTFLYESIWNIIGFILLVTVLKKIFKDKEFYATAFYLIWYGFIRIFIEMLRTDALMFFNIKIALITSLIMFLAGIIMFYKLIKKNKKGRI